MPNYTPNYNLIKPTQDEFYDVDDFNKNADKVDEALKEINNKINEIEVPVTSVNNKTGAVVLNAADVGAHPKITNGVGVWEWKVDANGNVYIEQMA